MVGGAISGAFKLRPRRFCVSGLELSVFGGFGVFVKAPGVEVVL